MLEMKRLIIKEKKFILYKDNRNETLLIRESKVRKKHESRAVQNGAC